MNDLNYIAQHDTFRCGPIAILNALCWAGQSVPDSTLDNLTASCKCRPPKGTTYRPFTSTLRQSGAGLFKVELKVQPTLRFIEARLHEGAALVWNFKHNRNRHYALIVGISPTGKTFKIVNCGFSAQSVSTVRRNNVKQHVKQSDRWQRVWVLSRVEL